MLFAYRDEQIIPIFVKARVGRTDPEGLQRTFGSTGTSTGASSSFSINTPARFRGRLVCHPPNKPN